MPHSARHVVPIAPLRGQAAPKPPAAFSGALWAAAAHGQASLPQPLKRLQLGSQNQQRRPQPSV